MTAVAVVSMVASAAAATHSGIFGANTADVGALFQTYLATAAATALIVGATVAERRDATDRLVESERHLSLVFDSNSDTLLSVRRRRPRSVSPHHSERRAARHVASLSARERRARTVRHADGRSSSPTSSGIPRDRVTRNNDVFRRAIQAGTPSRTRTTTGVGPIRSPRSRSFRCSIAPAAARTSSDHRATFRPASARRIRFGCMTSS
jgi:hypothetical protein